MLKVLSFLHLSGGSLGETTFMKVNGKYTAREKSVINKELYKTSPSFARGRENTDEFTRAAKSGKLIRESLPGQVKYPERTVTRRLHKEMLRVIKSDPVSGRGERNANLGDIKLLIGFNFNIKARLRAAFNVNYTTEMNRETGNLIINIPSFNPVKSMKAPVSATHYKIVSSGIAINFVTLKDKKSAVYESPLLPIDDNNTVAITAVHNVPVGQDDNVLLILGIEFLKVAGKWTDIVSNNSFDCRAIVDAG